MKRLIFLFLLFGVVEVSAQAIRPRAEWAIPQHVKDTSSIDYKPIQYWTRHDSLLAYMERVVLGDLDVIAQVVRGVGNGKPVDASIGSGIAAVSKGNDSLMSAVYSYADGTTKIFGKNTATVAEFRKDSTLFNARGTSKALLDSGGFKISGNSTSALRGLVVTQYSTYAPLIILRRYEGSESSPSPITTGLPIGGLATFGYDGTNINGSSGASIAFFSTENWTNTAHGGSVNFNTVKTGTTTVTTAMRISGTQNIGIGLGTSDATAKLQIAAGSTEAGTAPLKFTPGPLMTNAEVGALEASNVDDSLRYTGPSGIRRTLALGGTGGGGAGGKAGGWTKTSIIKTDTAAIKVYVMAALSDTTTYSSLFNVGGTSSFGNDVTFYSDLYYNGTKIFNKNDTSLYNISWKGKQITQSGIVSGNAITDGAISGTTEFHGMPISDTYLATISTAGKVSGSAITSGTIGGTTAINTSGAIQTSSTMSAASFSGSLSGGDIVSASITGAKIALATITGGNIAAATIDGSNIKSATITATNIANATITGTQIALATITGANIGSATIAGSNLINGTITSTQIGSATITGSNIASATITGTNIASGTITTGNIATGTITGGNIASGTITGGNISSATITAGLIGNLEITAAQIANLTINGTKITSETLDSTKLKDGSVSGADLAVRTITASKIAAATITANEIAASTITGSLIAANTIAAGNIVANTITAAEIKAGTITATEIANSTITGSQIAASTITGSNIYGGTIDSSKIANATITNSNLKGSITADKLVVGTLSAITANLGTVTAGNISGTDINIGTGAFHVTTAGALTATSATITGSITGSTITGSTLTTGATGAHVEVGTGGAGLIDFYSATSTKGATIAASGVNFSISTGTGGALQVQTDNGFTVNSYAPWYKGASGSGFISSLGSAAAAQYMCNLYDVHGTQLYTRTLTIDGVTVHVVTTD
jgi:uncharacterized protein YjbI with pentapeptide repeats